MPSASTRRLDELQQRRQRLGNRAQEVDSERQRLSAEIENDAETQARARRRRSGSRP